MDVNFLHIFINDTCFLNEMINLYDQNDHPEIFHKGV